MQEQYFVYIMASKSRVLYTGATNDLARRVHEHKSGSGASFIGRYKVAKLVYYETTTDVMAAIAREKEIKGWVRSKKTGLIQTSNPQWRDLSRDWSRFPELLRSAQGDR